MKRQIKEPLIAYLILGLFNYFFFPEDPAFISISLHPYLFITILFAVRYGIWAGALSGVFGAGLIITAHVHESDFLEMELINGFDLLSVPLSIIIFGILIGETVESRLKKTQYYQGALKKEVKNQLSKSTEVKALRESLLSIEKKMAGHSLGVRNFSENLLLIFEKDRKAIYRYIPELLHTFAHIEESLILISNPDVYHQSYLSSNNQKLDETTLLAIRENPVYRQALLEKRVCSVTEYIEDLENEEGEETLFYCGPVMSSEDHIDAMVIVRKIPFIQFNVTNFRIFDVIVNAAGLSIKSQKSYQQLYESSPWHEKWPVEREYYFVKNLCDIASISEEMDVVVTGFRFSSSCGEGQQFGFMTLLCQLCLGEGVRIGYIASVNCFAFYKVEQDGPSMINDIRERFGRYGFSESFAKLSLCHLKINSQHAKREQEFLTHLMSEAFLKAVEENA
ncbi:MAG: hypothetical protein HQL32_02310 [Planctomycetes bacterium]|nr:hypothetical protein [Planctomycetota bacterium]